MLDVMDDEPTAEDFDRVNLYARDLLAENERLRDALADVRHQAADTTLPMLDALDLIRRISTAALTASRSPEVGHV